MTEPIPVTQSETVDELEEDRRVRSLGTATLETQVRVVAEKREQVGQHKQYLARLDRDYQDSTAHVRQMVTNEMQELEAAERVLRLLAVERFRETRNRQPAAGVKIREEVTLAYDEADAIRWARETPAGASCLQLDRRSFEGAAKNLSLDFVEKKTEPKATIARDLTAALEAAGESDAA